ncbi:MULTISPECIES: dihydropteroate synthase [Spirulina sp. CCY15215]|uniref:dihydropteroate synthase n=1 Tax=Spirulina sp. CCY15215 TaxID=2767591 RepID=UPI001950EE7C|nr:dihydropteroate synthase [Spirulina major]
MGDKPLRLTPWEIRGRSFVWGERTFLMGILNVTPDSFSDGGEFNNIDAALTQARLMESSGADIIDIGGQSTRPGSVQISLQEELDRTIAIIEGLRSHSSIPISIDTTRSQVAKAAIAAGADIVNDISGGTFDEEMFPVVAKLGIPYILMHLRGTPETMQTLTDYDDVVGEISRFFAEQIEKAVKAGIARSHLMLDPGIGFGKTYSQNIEIFQRLPEFQSLNLPVLVGPSRKSFIGHFLGKKNPKERIWGTAAACCSAIASGCDVLRVHDVSQIADVCRLSDQIWRKK